MNQDVIDTLLGQRTPPPREREQRLLNRELTATECDALERYQETWAHVCRAFHTQGKPE